MAFTYWSGGLPAAPVTGSDGTGALFYWSEGLPAGVFLTAPISYSLTAAAGAFVMTGYDVASRGKSDAGVFTLTGQDVSLSAIRRMSADVGSFVLTGFASVAAFSRRADAGHFFLTGMPVDFAATQSYLPRASSGLNYYLYVRDAFQVKARSGDTIYDGASTGTVLRSTQKHAILKLVSPARGLWFVSHKRGTWSLT